MKTTLFWCTVAFASAHLALAASPFVGTFKNQEGSVRIAEIGAGKFSGQLLSDGQSLPFTAQEKGRELVGRINIEDENVEFRMTLKGSELRLIVDDEATVFIREASPSTLGQRPASGTVPPASNTARSQQPPLSINGVTIDDATLQRFEQDQRVKLPRGKFWYDTVSGAWGVDGGPTLGFTTPGMKLGGQLQANASRGNTGVFINKRELPAADVVGLQQLGVPVQRGRWWVDSRGNFGIEGQPATMGNLFQFSQNKGGAYQRATAGGYIGGDGQTSYFFDPKSGSSVMVGN